ncbi:MAG: hypothetical protein ACOC22_01710 [bacterium]
MENRIKQGTGTGIGLGGITFIILLVLKLTNQIDMNWFLVITSFIWVPIVVAIVVFAIVFVIVLILGAIGYSIEKLNK